MEMVKRMGWATDWGKVMGINLGLEMVIMRD